MKKFVVVIVFAVTGMIITPCHVAALVNINTATITELQTLPGIGPGLAQLIVDHRETNGPFQSVSELMDVPKIGNKIFEKVKDLVTIDPDWPASDASSKTANGDMSDPEKAAPVSTPQPSIEEIMALFDGEPSVRETQMAAIRFAEIDASRFMEWRQKVKEKGLWPDTFQLAISQGTDDDYDYTRANTIGISGGTAYVGPDKETWKHSTDDDLDYQLRVRWKLQDYCFNTDMLRVSSETEKQVKFRQSIVEDVTRLYYDRRKLQVEMILQPDVSLMVQVKRTIQFDELTAALDGLTGGFFSDAIRKTGTE